MTDFGAVLSSVPLIRGPGHVGVEGFRKGSTAPTDVLVGTTPSTPALLFDATAELVSGSFELPVNYAGGDVTFILYGALVNVQLNGDVWSWNVDYLAVTPGTTGEGITKASTNLTPSRTITTGEGLAVDDVYDLVITFSAADGTNPLSTAVKLIVFEMGLANLTGVAAIHALHAVVEFDALY